MKIAMLTNNYKPFIGGVPISIERLKDALTDLGHEVYVFAPTYEEEQEEEAVIRYPVLPGKIGGAVIPNCFTKRMEEEVVRLGIDLIHVHHPLLAGNTALHLKKKYGIPVVFTYHTRYEQYLHYIFPFEKLGKKMAEKMIDLYMRHFMNQCDYIFAPTTEVANHLEEMNLDTEVGVLPTGLMADSYRPDEAHVKEIRALYQKENGHLFSCVARLAKEKNLEFLLRAMKEYKGLTKEPFELMLIGDGPERENLRQTAIEFGLADEISFVGNVPNNEIKDYLAASDAFLFSSKSETQGIVLLEAMAVGNPVIAIDASGVCDLIEQGVNGFKVPDDPAYFAKTLHMILGHFETHFTMKQNAYLIARTYQEKNIARKALFGYKEALYEDTNDSSYTCKHSYAS